MVIEEIKNRRSIRTYKSEKITADDIDQIIIAAQFAPTANNNRKIEYVIIKNPDMKEKIWAIAKPHQDFVKQAPVLIIPITLKAPLAIADLSVASQNIFIQATALGLGSIWKNCYPPVAEEIKALLIIPEEYTLVNIIPIGYADQEILPYREDQFDCTKIHNESF